MPIGVSFKDEWQAEEYAKIMSSRGWRVLEVRHNKPVKDPATGRIRPTSWRVTLLEIKDGKSVGAKEISKLPGTLAEALSQEEERASATERHKRQFKAGLHKQGEEALKRIDTEGMDILSGRSTERVLKNIKERRRMDVVSGMKRSIPKVATPIGAHTVFGRGSELPPAISEMRASAIASAPSLPGRGIASVPDSRIAQETGMPRIAGSTGVSRESGFRLGVSESMRFQTPRMRRLTVGHSTIPEPKENEGIE